MSTSSPPRSNELFATFFHGVAFALACMALFVGAVIVMPATGPALWAGVPVSLFVGMVAIHRRLPDYTYPLGLVFIPVVGSALTLAAIQVYWTILRDSI
jgi:hypothetical protein